MSWNRDLQLVLRAVYATIQQSQVTFLAAAIAYYAFVSIIPLAFLGLAVGQLLGPGRLAPLLTGADQFLTPGVVDIVTQALADSTTQGGATVVGLGFLAWSASKVFRGLDVAFSQVYGVSEVESLPSKLLDAAVVLLGIPAALVAGAVLGVLLPLFDWLPLAGVLSRLALLAVLSVVFFPMYYRLPDVEVSVREAIPGTLVAAVGWAVLATGFSLYTTYVTDFQLYGILGAALLLVTWLYLGGIIIMVGAVVNTVVAGSPTDVRPDGGERNESGSDRHEPAPDVGDLGREVDRLREDLDEKTVSRSDLEAELQAYVRKRQREGKATGWGPYLVLLYGTIMTLGAFYWLDGGWAILAMIVVWLSTLGLYVQLVLFGIGLQAASVPGRLIDIVRTFRS
ncbi:MAG: YihY/virulence factor BrkB family protein [Halodesulfurarchaeum sp.]|nr:YihY/virulence factor BrkB family protein [Halodesulfurarchaeum sp.]